MHKSNLLLLVFKLVRLKSQKEDPVTATLDVSSLTVKDLEVVAQPSFHSNGSITDVTVVSPGSGYRDPVAYIYDVGSKILATTSNIGQITSMQVNDYGRNISTDLTLNPEIHPVIRLVIVALLEHLILVVLLTPEQPQTELPPELSFLTNRKSRS